MNICHQGRISAESYAEITELLHQLPTTICCCDECLSMCKNPFPNRSERPAREPCYPTPDEAQILIELGYGNKMMLVEGWYSYNFKPLDSDIPIEYECLGIAWRSKEGRYVSSGDRENKRNIAYLQSQQCCLFQHDACLVHFKCKPIEAQLAGHTAVSYTKLTDYIQDGFLSYRMVLEYLWTGKQGREILDYWKKLYYKGDK